MEMDGGHEFDFPPDHVSNDVRTPSLHSISPSVPFGVLVRTPVHELPPTPPPTTPHCTIGQLLRGSMHHQQQQASRAALGGARGTASLTALPRSTGPAHTVGTLDSDDFWLEEPTGSAHHSAPPESSAALATSTDVHAAKQAEARPESVSASAGSDPETDEVHRAEDDGGAMAPAKQAGAPRHQRLEWTEKEVRDFYKALSQFGTDFGAIAVLFPSRQRNQVKKLYQREYRKHRADVLRALDNKEDIDMEAYQQLLAARKAREAPKKKKLAVSEEELLHEIASGAVATSASTTAVVAPEDVLFDDMLDGDVTVAQFVSRAARDDENHQGGGGDSDVGDSWQKIVHDTGLGHKRARAAHDEDATDHADASPAKAKRARPQRHEAAPEEPHEETLFEMSARQDAQFAKQTLFEAAMDGEFGTVFSTDANGGPAEDADDFTF